MKTIRLLLVVAGCIAGGVPIAARAASVGGYSLPDTYAVDGQTLHLNGIGIRALSIIGIKIYVAALYLAAPGRDARAIEGAATPKVLLLQYLHDGSKQQVEDEYRKGQRQNCGHGECPQSDAADFERLVAAAPPVKVGDTTTYIVTSRGLRVLANNRPVIDIANPDLGMRMLDGFIGAHPPTTDLRDALLGNTR